MRILTSIFFIFGSVLAWSQTTEIQRDYLNAKAYFREGQYALARAMFEELRKESPDSPFSPYATYYSGISAYKQGYPVPSRNTFLELLKRYPDWENADEARLWLSHLFFESEEPYYALEVGEEITDPDIRSQNDQLQDYFLSRINSTDSLKSMYNLFSTNEVLARTLAEKELLQPFNSRDYDLLNDLAGLFPSVRKLLEEQMLQSEYKETYVVSCLFPFALEQIKADLSPKVNEFVLELYRGIQLAADSLNHGERKIEIQLFDTRRDSATLMGILDNPDLARSDLIIGPLYNSELMRDYLIQNRINAVNPFTKNRELLEGNPFYYLYSILPEHVGMAAAAHVLADSTLKRGKIFYGSAQRDRLIAAAFTDSLSADSTRQWEAFEVPPDNINLVLREITSISYINDLQKILDREDPELDIDTLDFIFVANTQRGGAIYSNVLTAAEATMDTVAIIGTHFWLNDQAVDPDKLRDLDVRLFAYDVFLYTNGNFVEFQDKYLKKFGNLPSKYAATGYDLMMTFGQLMLEYGNYFQMELNEEATFIEGVLSPGFNYYRSNSNRYIPYLRWTGTDISVLNKPLKERKQTDEEEK